VPVQWWATYSSQFTVAIMATWRLSTGSAESPMGFVPTIRAFLIQPMGREALSAACRRLG
jgi:hypothetical protein